MSVFDKVEGIARRTMVLFLLVDKSGSMQGTKIGAVNVAIREVIPELQQIANDASDANIKIAVLTFSTDAEWMYKEPIDVKDFQWTNIDVSGLTNMGTAFKLLNEKLSKEVGGFMSDTGGSFAPILFLMSDALPTDTDNYRRELDELKKNKWFTVSLKVAIAIGADADEDVLKEFTGSSESVLKVHTPEALRKLVKFVSVNSTQIGSKGGHINVSGDEQAKQKELNSQIKDVKNTLGNSCPDDGWN